MCLFLILVLNLTIYILLSKLKHWLWVFPKILLKPFVYYEIFLPKPIIVKYNLDSRMLKCSSERERKEPRSLNIFDKVDGIEIQSSLFFWLASREEEDSWQGRNHCSRKSQAGAVSYFLRSALNRVANSLHYLLLLYFKI